MQLPAAVQLILHRLLAQGFQAYAVGGCVRDALRGVTPHDWDICTSALPEEVHAALSDLHLIDTGITHGTVTVRLEGQSYEVTTFRRDGAYSDHRRPDQVEFVPVLEEDLARRDFTMNAMAVGADGQVIDRFGGQADLQAGVLRCVGDPTQRFQEDALRILRALRFAATLNLTIEADTAAAALAQRELLRYVSAERIYSELNKLLLGPGAARVLGDYVDIFTVLLPEITPCVGFDQRNPCHYQDVWNHTLTALSLSQPDRIIRWSLLLHDLGKPTAFFQDQKGIGHFRGHPKISAALAREIFARLKADKDSRDRICWLVYHHDTPPPTNRPTLLRWMQEASLDDLKRLAEIRRCDGAAHTDHPIMTIVRGNTQTFAQLLTDPTLESAPITVTQLAVTGTDLMALGIPQGEALGTILHWLLDQVIDEACPNEREALLAYWSAHWKEEHK